MNAELNSRANQLAWYLKDRGVGPHQLVAICAERSVDMVVGLLGLQGRWERMCHWIRATPSSGCNTCSEMLHLGRC